MCIFCDIIAHKIPSKVVYEDDNTLAILDISQVTKGHTIVMPKKHCTSLLDADEDTAVSCMKVINRLSKQIVKNTGASACNVLNNSGEAAGQTVDHLHFHIIPRYGENDCVVFKFNPSPEQDLDEVLKEVTK